MLKNFVHETATGTTWPLALQGVVATGFRTVLSAFGSGKKALLTVRNRSDPSEWETALYTVNADGSINRAAADVRDGTNGTGVLVSFTAGVKDVFCDADAALLVAAASKLYWGGTTTNATNAYSVTVPEPVPTAYSAGMVVFVIVNAANTGAATINVNGLGAKAITKSGTTALAAGDLPANAVVALTYDGTQFQLSTGAAGAAGGWTVASKSAAYTVVAADRQTFFLCSGTWTLALTAAATLGAGFTVSVKNNGTGTITIDPNGSETVQGAATLVLGAGDTVMLICDGSAWHLLDSYLTGTSPVFSNMTVFTSNGTFTVPAGVYRIRVSVTGGGGGGANNGGSGAGGTSSFGSVCSATGGAAGSGSSSTGSPGGSGGTGSGGTVKTGGVGGAGGWGTAGGGGGGSAGGRSGSSAPGEAGGSGYGGAGAAGSGGAAGGARQTSTATGNAGTSASGAESGGGGGGGFGAANSGGNGGTPGGGGGGATTYNTGIGYVVYPGGGGGGYVEAVISVVPGTQYAVTVGLGGTSTSGGTGGAGRVVVEY